MTFLSKRYLNNILGVPQYSITTFKNKSKKYALVIPILNERERIELELEEINSLNLDVDIYIADGGSTDGFTEIENLKRFKIAGLLVKYGDGGLSSQLRMAFHHGLKLGYEGLITIDGNNKDDARGIARIIEALEDGFDFVQGSRFLRGGSAINTPKVRYLSIKFIHAPLISLGARMKFTDTTNGFRGHSNRLLLDKKVEIFRDIFDTYELLAYLPVRACRLGFRAIEVPVARSYPKKQPTPTKIKGLKSYANLLRILIKAVLGKYNPVGL